MILRGSKVILRPLEEADAGSIALWYEDPKVNRFMGRRVISVSAERKRIRLLKGNQNSQEFAILLATNQLIGSVWLHDIDKSNRRARLGTLIGLKKYWDKGLGTEAKTLVLNYAFSKLHLHRIYVDVYSFNKRNIRVNKKLGFRKEGVKREHLYLGGRYYDHIMMGILSTEWNKNKRSR